MALKRLSAWLRSRFVNMISTKFFILTFWAGILLMQSVGTCFAQVTGDSPVKVVSIGEFVASDEIKNAGIHGAVSVSVVIDKSGAVKKVDFISGPMWLCNSDPRKEITALRDSIEKLIRTAKFEPAKVNGKPITFEGTFEFVVAESEIEKEARKEFEVLQKEIALAKASGRQIVLKLGNSIDRKEPEFSDSALRAVYDAEVQVEYLVDKSGKVVSAGIKKGPKILHVELRDAVCKSRYEPSTMDGRPVAMLITDTFFVKGGSIQRIK